MMTTLTTPAAQEAQLEHVVEIRTAGEEHEVTCSACGVLARRLAVRAAAESVASWHRTQTITRTAVVAFTAGEWNRLCSDAAALQRTPHELIHDKALGAGKGRE